ncbi:MAG: hypothetical protein H0W84_08835 [Bacteroidetes bacterium]|nr:hypothetical protein [Bacteroidota bacterium]
MYTEEHDYSHHKRRKKKKSKKGLHGTGEAKGKPGAKKNTGLELSKPLLIVGGLLAGNLIGKGIDKFIAVPADATGFQIKALVKPLVQAGLGVGIILLAREGTQDKDSTKTIKALARSLGYGVAGAGVISGVKLVKSDLFDGLGNDDSQVLGAKPIEAKYYREAKNEIMQMLQDNSFRPALPEGDTSRVNAADNREAEMSGLHLGESDNEDVSGLGIEDAEIM